MSFIPGTFTHVREEPIMLSNLLPAVAEAVWPDHIEIELRIEIQR